MIAQLLQLREHNKNVLKELRAQTKQNNIAVIIDALLSVPGVGFITAITLYTEIIDMNRFSNDARTAAFVGLVPSTRSSDETIYNNGISFRQNKFLRPILIEAAWTAVKQDPAMTLKYKELTKRMKSQDAIIRIAKKLLRRIRHVWLKQEQYAFSLVA
jgi:transposase